MEFGKRILHKIRITPTMNHGFVVQVGCETFAFESYQSMLESLSNYLSDPKDAEMAYNRANYHQPPPPLAPPQFTTRPQSGGDMAASGSCYPTECENTMANR